MAADRSSSSVTALILAAGKGTRMKSSRSKVLHEIGGLSLMGHVIRVAGEAGADRTVVVTGHDGEAVAAEAERHADQFDHVVQERQLGTGHAVQVALKSLSTLADAKSDVLVLFGDTPLLRPANIQALREGREAGASVVVLGFRPDDASEYGRLVVDGQLTHGVWNLKSIVEFKDASDEERAIDFCNGGALLIEGGQLSTLIGALTNDNAKGEYYLTDVVAHAVGSGLKAAAVEAETEDVMGVNSRSDLADAEAVFQARARAAAMAEGASLADPESVYFSFDTKLGQDVSVAPHVFFGPGVDVADDVTIKAFSHLEGARVGPGAEVGPFARLRPEAKIGKGVRVGNFVEIKKATIKNGAKVNHLTYIGDAVVGARTNIGAGTITCNYDGYNKYFTDIGHDVFIGSNTALVAPVKIGDGANIAAGSTITGNVSDDALGVARGKQRNIDGWAPKYRAKKQAEKDRKK